MGVNAQTESYSAITNSALSSEYAAVVGSNGVATNVSNGSSKVNFSTTNVTVEAVGSSDPADLVSIPQKISSGKRRTRVILISGMLLVQEHLLYLWLLKKFFQMVQVLELIV